VKKLAFLICILFMFSFQKPVNKLEGTWKLVSYKGVNNGVVTHTISSEKEGHQLKTWSKNHFLFVGKFVLNGEWMNNFGSGIYSLQDNHYTENIIVHSGGSDYENISAKLLIEFKGDTLIQINPVKDDWTYDEDNCRIEKYVRAE